jgi:hypothetical protein
MSIAIALIGGPADGRDIILPDNAPPYRYRVVIEKPLAVILGLDDPFDITNRPYSVAEYEPILEQGWPSLTDDGRYRYGYHGMEPEPHPRQSRPTPTVDELATMTRDPQPTAYPDGRSHLLGCRVRHSLRRDARLSPEEQRAVNAVTWDRIRQERPDFPERRPF